MAEKVRCISNAILFNDNYLTLPHSAKVLYEYVNNETDDAGFCDHVKGLMQLLRVKQSDLNLLVSRGYLIEVCAGWLYLEKHFFINNRGLRRDRLKVSRYAEYLEAYEIKENGAYTLKRCGGEIDDKLQPNGDNLASNCRQNDTIREDKIREDKLIKDIKEKQGKEKHQQSAEIINEYLTRRGLQ